MHSYKLHLQIHNKLKDVHNPQQIEEVEIEIQQTISGSLNTATASCYFTLFWSV